MRVAALAWAAHQRPGATIVPEADRRAYDSPDPLHDYRAVILGVFACVLVMGGAYVIAKSNNPPPAVAVAGATAAATVADEVAPRDHNAKLLEATKEELFQLELDRQQGKISPDEYAKAKAALDETIRRALARGGRH